MQTRKFLRSAAAMLLAGAMMTGAVSAEITENQEISMDDFVSDSIKTSLELGGYEDGTYSISALVPVYNFETGDLCNYRVFVMSENKLIAEMDIWEGEDSGYISMFSDEVDDTTVALKESGQSICYGIYNGKMWLCSNYTDLYEISCNYGEDKDETEDLCIPLEPGLIAYSEQFNEDCLQLRGRVTLEKLESVGSINFKREASEENATVRSVSKATSDTSVVLDLVHVKNGCIPGASEPSLCWAACIAMKTNYICRNKADYTLKSAESVYNYLAANDMLCDGSIECVLNAYNAFGIPVVGGYVQVNNRAVWNTLSKGHPIDLSLSGTTSTGKTGCHQILIYGMKKAATGLGYLINCPNKKTANGKKVVSISGDVDDLMGKYVDTMPYLDNWTYKDGTTIEYKNVQRTYYTKNTI